MENYFTEELKINEINDVTKELFSIAKERLSDVLTGIKEGYNYIDYIELEADSKSFKTVRGTYNSEISIEEIEDFIKSLDCAKSFKYNLNFTTHYCCDGLTTFQDILENKTLEYFDEKFDLVADYAEYRCIEEAEYDYNYNFYHFNKVDGVLYGFKDNPVYSQKVKHLPLGNWGIRSSLFVDIPACCNKGVVTECIKELTEIYGEPDYEEDGNAFNVIGPSYMFYSIDVKNPNKDAEILLKLIPAIDEIIKTGCSKCDPDKFNDGLYYRDYGGDYASDAQLCLDFKNNDYYFIVR